MATKSETRTLNSWKKEVKGITDGLPPSRAAEVIRRIAESSLEAGEISNATYERAIDWADRVYWA